MVDNAVGFDPGRYLISLKGKDYLEVKWRLVWLRNNEPNATIETELISLTDQQAVFKATVTTPSGASASGFGTETPRDFGDYIEKAETKAVGRALGMLGYGTQFSYEFEEGDRIVDSPTNNPQQNNVPPRARNTSQNTVVGTHTEPVDGWTGFWAAARRAGLADKQQVEAAIGQLGAEPQEALNRLNAKMTGQPVQQQAPMHAPPPANGQAATPRQIQFIQSIARDRGMAEEQLAAEIDELYGRPLDQLDRRDASAFIERLQTRRNVTEIAS